MGTKDIWNAFSAELLGFIKSRISDTHIAEDILQDVFVKIHAKSHTLNDDDKLASWVYQITRNSIIDYYRKKNVLSYKEDIEDKFPEEEPSSELGCLHCLKPFVEKLPDADRHILEKTVFENMSQKQYAKEFGLSYTATKSRVQRARKKMKAQFVNCCSAKYDAYGNVLSSNHNHCDC